MASRPQAALTAAKPPAHDGPPLLLSARETARMLCMGERTLARLTAAGELPSLHVGASLRYDMRDVLALVEKLKEAERSGKVVKRGFNNQRAERAEKRAVRGGRRQAPHGPAGVGVEAGRGGGEGKD